MSKKDTLLATEGNNELNSLKTATIADNNKVENITESGDSNLKSDSISETNTDLVETETQHEIENSTPNNNKLIEVKIDTHVEDIEKSNAEDAEDEHNKERHILESKDYHAMSMEQLVSEFEKLLKHQKIQTIKSHVDEIKSEFNSKFSALLDEKKENFLNDGGNEIDFYYSNDAKKRFSLAYKTYRNDLNAYYKNLEQNLKANLENRLRIIEEIKGLINVEENINTTYKHFKELQEQWRHAGPIPRDKYNNAWNTYHHHVEIFYDFLHLNRDLRDMDFKHNLDQKLKIIERAEELAKDDNINRAFRELQALHKLWKEDLGPVNKEHREKIWERFSNASKTIHDRRQAFYADLDKAYEKNLEVKENVIDKIQQTAQETVGSHKVWQEKIRTIEVLRNDFFNTGRIPQKVNEIIWIKFKNAIREFNKNKNAFYKGLKKEQYANLQKKIDLIKIAEDNKDSVDFETTTPLMKKIQSDWKKIGHVPRKDSDRIWNQFKTACNFYFDKVYAERNAANKEQTEAFEKKEQLLNDLKNIELTGVAKDDVNSLKEKIAEWKKLGSVNANKHFIETNFNKTLDALFEKIDLEKSEIDLIKFENKLETLSNPGNKKMLDSEHNFIRKKIEDVKSEINQLENNLQFFSNVDEDNPLLKEVHNNIEKRKKSLSVWKAKFKKIKEIY